MNDDSFTLPPHQPARASASRRRGRPLLTISLVALTVTATLTLWPREYAGRTTFRIHPGGTVAVSAITSRDAPPPAREAWLEMHTRALTSPDTLLPVVRSLDLSRRWGLTEQSAVTRLAGQLEVEPGTGAGVVTLTAWSRSAAEAADIANEVCHLWQQRRLVEEEERARLRTETQLQIVRQAVESARTAMTNLLPGSDGNGGEDTAPPGDTARAKLIAEHRETLAARDAEAKQIQRQLHSLDGQEGDALISPAAVLGLNNETFTKIYPELQIQLTAFAEAEKSFGPKHPKMQALTASIEAHRAMLINSVEAHRASLADQLQQAETATAEARKQLASRSREVAVERNQQRPYVSAKYDHERLLTSLQGLEERAQKRSADGKPPWQPASVLSAATPANSPSRPCLLLLLSLSTAAGLFLSMLLILCADYRRAAASRRNS